MRLLLMLVCFIPAIAHAELYLGLTGGVSRYTGQKNVADGISSVLSRERFDVHRTENPLAVSGGVLFGYQFKYRNARLRIEREYADMGKHRSRIDAGISNQDFFGQHISDGYFWATVTTHIKANTNSIMPGWAWGRHQAFLKIGSSKWVSKTECYEWSQLVGRTPEIVTNMSNGEWGTFARATGSGKVLGVAYEYRAAEHLAVRVFADVYSDMGNETHVLADGSDAHNKEVLRAGFGLIYGF